jgi:hypothetical protein
MAPTAHADPERGQRRASAFQTLYEDWIKPIPESQGYWKQPSKRRAITPCTTIFPSFRLTSCLLLPAAKTLVGDASRLGLNEAASIVFAVAKRVHPNDDNIRSPELAHLAHSYDPNERRRARASGGSTRSTSSPKAEPEPEPAQ